LNSPPRADIAGVFRITPLSRYDASWSGHEAARNPDEVIE
jgi:hypothetical protein